MLQLFKKHTSYFIPFLVLLLATGIFHVNTEHGDFLLWLNRQSTSFLDVFFQVITYVGDGLLIMILSSLILLFYHLRFGLGLILAFLSSGILAQLIKRSVSAPRPRSYFPDFETLHLIPDLYYSSSNSFPSGHTATAFAFFTFLALMTKSRFFQIVYLVLATMVGISRVYLLQHFLLDITVGAVLGLICGLFSYMLVKKINNENIHLSGLKWYQNKKAQP